MFVLTGQLVPMRGAAAPPTRGAVYVADDGTIAAVTPYDAVPAGFEAAPRVASGGAIYPGLVDLHNHLLFNTLPLWREPARQVPWTSHEQWPSAATYHAQVYDPASLLGAAAGRAVLRYVETRAIVGGTTSVQGNPKGSTPPDDDLVRNVDSERFGTTTDFIRVRTIVATDPADLAVYKQGVDAGQGFIYHVCEGSAPGLVHEFDVLEQAKLVEPPLVAIHGTALGGAQLQDLVTADATLVWSPFSNLWLYGATADVATAHGLGVRLCLGSDWAPSGTKNVLWELKVADLWNRAQAAPVFSDEELCALVTRNPGIALGRLWQRPLGTLEKGAVADLAVFGRRVTDPYRNLIGATERDVRLVVVGGKARYGTRTLLRSLGAATATSITVAGRPRAIDYGDATVSYASVLAALNGVRSDPPAAVARVRSLARSLARGGDGAERAFVLRPDKPDPELGEHRSTAAALATVGPVSVPPIQPLAPDADWFDAVDRNPWHGGLLSGLRGYAGATGAPTPARAR